MPKHIKIKKKNTITTKELIEMYNTINKIVSSKFYGDCNFCENKKYKKCLGSIEYADRKNYKLPFCIGWEIIKK